MKITEILWKEQFVEKLEQKHGVLTEEVMEKSKEKKSDSLPEEFSSLEEAGEFWDTHSGTDFEKYMREAHFDVELKHRAHEVRITNQLWREMRKIAQQQGVATETLINLWLQEKITATLKHSS